MGLRSRLCHLSQSTEPVQLLLMGTEKPRGHNIEFWSMPHCSMSYWEPAQLSIMVSGIWDMGLRSGHRWIVLASILNLFSCRCSWYQ
ncbi:hypothetical protein AVEN_232300-1 [Araneus ventricosus]|uniref:Uncharacterized protein n=1 Tax=Araneus ventricosus TaxID=182803 RepID=A0A4Y2WSE3_ARAVE|nr:hypothetical protein AVEN_232300-1 [Araneus ventricosus]